MNCPRCQRPLTAHQAPRFVMHACTGCGGMFLDGSASRTVVSAVDPAAMSAADAVGRAAEQAVDVNAQAACPVCRNAMERMPIQGAGVIVDACREHGVWFDRNELQQVVRSVAGAPAPQGAPPPPPPMQGAPPPPPMQGAPPAPPSAPAQPLPPGMAAGQYVAPGWLEGSGAPQAAPPAPMAGAPGAGPPLGGLSPGMSAGQYQAPGWADPQTGQPPPAQGQGWSTAKTALAVGAGVAAVGGLAYVATHTDLGKNLVSAVTGDGPPPPYGQPPPPPPYGQPSYEGQYGSPQGGTDFGSIGQVLSKLF